MEYENQDFTLSLEDSKKASREMEMYYGKFGLVVAKWFGRLEELERPGPLAIVIARKTATPSAILRMLSIAARG